MIPDSPSQEAGDGHDPTAYGRRAASDYDVVYADVFDTDHTVERLVELSDGGSVLEFGVGTGRLALELVERGLDVHGIDASAEMLSVLAMKPGGDAVTTTLGDFSAIRVPGSFAVVVLAVNTLFALPDQPAQVQCFTNAAAHLRTGGRFVVEAWVPDIGAFSRNRRVYERDIGGDEVAIVTARLAPATQQIHLTQMQISDRGCRLFPLNHRYAWPAELDLMARLAGLELEQRWEDLQRTPFDDESMNHVSVYRRVG